MGSSQASQLEAVGQLKSSERMQINKTGTDIKIFEHIFRDGNGEAFRSALSESYSFASQIIQTAKKVKPYHGLELWDQAVQYKLEKINQSENLFIDGTDFLLEKQDSVKVWQYGYSITKSRRKGQRFWTLPDGIIKIQQEVIALEFDHGKNIGRWANQLIKAVRLLASKYIDGVLYCFCMEKDLNSSGHLITEQYPFTGEFLSLLQANIFEKKLGIITLFPIDWCDKFSIEQVEVFDFFRNTYIVKKTGSKSRKTAQEILDLL